MSPLNFQQAIALGNLANWTESHAFWSARCTDAKMPDELHADLDVLWAWSSRRRAFTMREKFELQCREVGIGWEQINFVMDGARVEGSVK